jgi:predicted RNase H-like HicB family nuclease
VHSSCRGGAARVQLAALLLAGQIRTKPILHLEIIMARQFDVIIERDSEGYYVASVPALRGCHTQAKSLDELMERAREAIELCLEVQGEEIESLEFVGVQRIVIAA